MVSMKNATMYSYWLLPDEPHYSHLAETIRRLAHAYGGPIFEPHVTLYTGEACRKVKDRVLSELNELGQNIELTPIGVSGGGLFTKTLFLQFALTKEISSLCKRVRDLQTAVSSFQIDPHLSLLYMELVPEARQNLMENLVLYQGSITFSSIRVIETEFPVNEADVIQRWSNIGSTKLIP